MFREAIALFCNIKHCLDSITSQNIVIGACNTMSDIGPRQCRDLKGFNDGYPWTAFLDIHIFLLCPFIRVYWGPYNGPPSSDSWIDYHEDEPEVAAKRPTTNTTRGISEPLIIVSTNDQRNWLLWVPTISGNVTSAYQGPWTENVAVEEDDYFHV